MLCCPLLHVIRIALMSLPMCNLMFFCSQTSVVHQRPNCVHCQCNELHICCGPKALAVHVLFPHAQHVKVSLQNYSAAGGAW